MQKSEIVQLIRDYLGFNASLEESIILRHMDIIQGRYEGGDTTLPLPWFLMNETYTANTVASSRTVALPTGFIQFDEEWSLATVDSEGLVQELPRVMQRQVVESTREGRPNVYVLGANSIYLYPTPDDIYTIRMPHYAVSPALSGAATSPWFTYFPRLIIFETFQSLALATRDESLLRISDPLVNTERRNYLHKIEVMRNNQREIVMGG